MLRRDGGVRGILKCDQLFRHHAARVGVPRCVRASEERVLRPQPKKIRVPASAYHGPWQGSAVCLRRTHIAERSTSRNVSHDCSSGDPPWIPKSPEHRIEGAFHQLGPRAKVPLLEDAPGRSRDRQRHACVPGCGESSNKRLAMVRKRRRDQAANPAPRSGADPASGRGVRARVAAWIRSLQVRVVTTLPTGAPLGVCT